MSNLIKWFRKLNDKQKHLLVGFVCGALYSPVVFLWEINSAIISNLVASSALFIGKEFYDKYKPNPTGFDRVDLFADYLGWGFGVWLSSVLIVIPIHFIFR